MKKTIKIFKILILLSLMIIKMNFKKKKRNYMIMNCLKNKRYYKVGGLGQEMALNKNK